MKFLLSFFLSISLTVGFTQDTLRNQFTPMYSEYYVIHGEKSFEYYFHHCTGTVYGKGTVKKQPLSWEFCFDSIVSPGIHYSCSSSKNSDSLKVFFEDLPGVRSEAFFMNVQINQTTFQWIDSSGIVISKSGDNKYDIGLNDHEDNFLIQDISESCSEITVYVPNSWRTYHSPGKEKLEKKGDIFYLPYTTIEENRKQPWKKGKVHHRKHIFKFDKPAI